MKRLRTSLLPMLLAFLACGAFFPAKAQEAAQGTVYYVLPLQDMAGKTNFIPTSFDLWYQCAGITSKQETVGTVSNANVYTFTTSGANSSSGGWLSNGFDISPILTGDYDLLFDFRTTKSASYRIKLVIPGSPEVGNETEFTATPNGQWQTIRMNVTEKFPAFATSGATSGNAYVFSFVAANCQNGDTFDFANVRYVPKGTTDEPVVTTPSLAIAEASCEYKSATSVTASMKLNVENIDGTIRMAVLSTDENLGSGIWNQDDKPYKILAEKTVTAAEAAAGVTFDVENLPESTATPIVFAACTTGDTPVYAATKEGVASTSKTERGMVNTVYSESYNVAPYTSGISYTAANFNEDGSVKWTFPSWTDDEESRRANGISGRWVWIEPSTTKFAPNIIYAISNDKDGYIYFKMKIDEKATLPDGLEPHMWVNNNRGLEDGAETVNMKLEADGYWHWKSKWQYPNNSTVSYQLHLAFAGGSSKTRVFGYDVINAVDAPAKQPASVELTELARKHYGDDKISAQIYILPAYDAYSAPQDDFKDKPIPTGTWSHTRCPNDFANLNTEAYHFSPEMHYILSNDSQENASGTKSKLYFAFQLGDSYGMVMNESGEKESHSLKTIIPNDYQPQLRILKPKANTASTLSDAATRAADNYDEIEVIDMKQARGYLNTYEGTTTNEYDPNSEFVVGIKHTFTSIMNGEGYSRMQPRPYVMSSDDKVVTGIEEVASEAEAVPAVATVYNLQGMAVRVNVATENALEGLPAGIYIVNGKKYAVR